MADQIAAGATAGVVYRGETCQAMVDAVLQCLADLPQLAARAGEVRRYWVERHGYEAFLSWLECEITARSQA